MATICIRYAAIIKTERKAKEHFGMVEGYLTAKYKGVDAHNGKASRNFSTAFRTAMHISIVANPICLVTQTLLYTLLTVDVLATYHTYSILFCVLYSYWACNTYSHLVVNASALLAL